MENEVNQRRKKLPPNKLNTKGCCFFCLQILDFKTETGNEKMNESKKVSLRCVSRHLKLKLPRSSIAAPNLQSNTEEDAPTSLQEIEADLCHYCKVIVNNFSKSFFSLEKIQMEVNYWLKQIHQRISEASKKPDLVQNYSKRMTSDPETLVQLVFVDNLRKEISSKEERVASGPRVKLFRLSKTNKYLISKEKQNGMRDVDIHFEDEFNDADVLLPSPSFFETTETNCKSELPDFLTVPDVVSGKDVEKDDEVVPRIKKVVSIHKMTMYSKNATTGTFDCTRCKKQFKSHSGAWCHYKSVHFGKRYKCGRCGGSYLHLTSLRIHKKRCTGIPTPAHARPGTWSIFNTETKTYNCVKCKKEFPRPQTVWSHYQSVHLNKTYKCDVCGTHYSSKTSLLRHMTNCTGTVPPVQTKPGTKCIFNSATGRYNCANCKQEFLSRKICYHHYQQTHSKKYECNICYAVFNFRHELVRHQKTCKDNLQKRLEKRSAQEKDPKYRFTCEVCDKKYTTKQAQQRHNMVVHLKQLYSCNLCDKKFKSHCALAHHKNSSHLGKKLICRFCKKEVNGFIFHLKVHEGKCASRDANLIKSEVMSS